MLGKPDNNRFWMNTCFSNEPPNPNDSHLCFTLYGHTTITLNFRHFIPCTWYIIVCSLIQRCVIFFNIFSDGIWWCEKCITAYRLRYLGATFEFTAQRSVTRSFDVFFDLHPTNGWVNNGEAGDLRRHRAHYVVTVILALPSSQQHCSKYLKDQWWFPTLCT